MKEVQFEWYVMNEIWCSSETKFTGYPYHESDRIRPWNIFNNIHVNDHTNKLCREFKRKKMTFEEFTEELRKIIQWQEWGRCEYEILVGPHIPRENDKFQKIDCYMQVLPNIDKLARYVLTTYYPRLKI